FRAAGVVIYRSNRETITGSYTQDGDKVTLIVGKSHETGRIDGNKLVLATLVDGVAGTATVFLDKTVPMLAGRTCRGEWEHDKGTTAFTYEFRAGGVVIYRSGTETITGRYSQEGDRVVVEVGKSYETGRIFGGKLILSTLVDGVTGQATVFLD